MNMASLRVIIIGLDPAVIDYSSPAFAAFKGLNAKDLMAAMVGAQNELLSLGYEATLYPIDFGQTAETVVREHLAQKPYDCVSIGAGVRLVSENTSLFEKVVNAVHECAPQAKFCFNEGPTASVDDVRRWFPSSTLDR